MLGQKIDEGGIKDGLKVIDILVNSPATAKFIAEKLAVKFVSDNPSDALVGRVADAFHKSDGDIKTTLRGSVHRQGIFRTGKLPGKDQDAVRTGGFARSARSAPTRMRARRCWRC